VRSRVSTLVGMIFGFLIGVLLDALPGYTGYAVVFAIAGTAGALDIASFALMRLPPMRAPAVKNNLLQMIRPVLSDRRLHAHGAGADGLDVFGADRGALLQRIHAGKHAHVQL
jgi:hypothetical protein